MKVREKVALLFIVILFLGIACALCMPRSMKKSSLRRQMNNLKKPKLTRVPVPQTTPEQSRTSKRIFQNDYGHINRQRPVVKANDFPEVEYPIVSKKIGAFDTQVQKNTNQQNGDAFNSKQNFSSKLIKKLRESDKTNKKHRDTARLNSNVDQAENTPKMLADTNTFRYKDSQVFPKVNYPQSIAEIWSPNFWNFELSSPHGAGQNKENSRKKFEKDSHKQIKKSDTVPKSLKSNMDKIPQQTQKNTTQMNKHISGSIIIDNKFDLVNQTALFDPRFKESKSIIATGSENSKHQVHLDIVSSKFLPDVNSKKGIDETTNPKRSTASISNNNNTNFASNTKQPFSSSIIMPTVKQSFYSSNSILSASVSSDLKKIFKDDNSTTPILNIETKDNPSKKTKKKIKKSKSNISSLPFSDVMSSNEFKNISQKPSNTTERQSSPDVYIAVTTTLDSNVENGLISTSIIKSDTIKTTFSPLLYTDSPNILKNKTAVTKDKSVTELSTMFFDTSTPTSCIFLNEDILETTLIPIIKNYTESHHSIKNPQMSIPDFKLAPILHKIKKEKGSMTTDPMFRNLSSHDITDNHIKDVDGFLSLFTTNSPAFYNSSLINIQLVSEFTPVPHEEITLKPFETVVTNYNYENGLSEPQVNTDNVNSSSVSANNFKMASIIPLVYNTSKLTTRELADIVLTNSSLIANNDTLSSSQEFPHSEKTRLIKDLPSKENLKLNPDIFTTPIGDYYLPPIMATSSHPTHHKQKRKKKLSDKHKIKNALSNCSATIIDYKNYNKNNTEISDISSEKNKMYKIEKENSNNNTCTKQYPNISSDISITTPESTQSFKSLHTELASPSMILDSKEGGVTMMDKTTFESSKLPSEGNTAIRLVVSILEEMLDSDDMITSPSPYFLNRESTLSPLDLNPDISKDYKAFDFTQTFPVSTIDTAFIQPKTKSTVFINKTIAYNDKNTTYSSPAEYMVRQHIPVFHLNVDKPIITSNQSFSKTSSPKDDLDIIPLSYEYFITPVTVPETKVTTLSPFSNDISQMSITPLFISNESDFPSYKDNYYETYYNNSRQENFYSPTSNLNSSTTINKDNLSIISISTAVSNFSKELKHYANVPTDFSKTATYVKDSKDYDKEIDLESYSTPYMQISHSVTNLPVYGYNNNDFIINEVYDKHSEITNIHETDFSSEQLIVCKVLPPGKDKDTIEEYSTENLKSKSKKDILKPTQENADKPVINCGGTKPFTPIYYQMAENSVFESTSTNIINQPIESQESFTLVDTTECKSKSYFNTMATLPNFATPDRIESTQDSTNIATTMPSETFANISQYSSPNIMAEFAMTTPIGSFILARNTPAPFTSSLTTFFSLGDNDNTNYNMSEITDTAINLDQTPSSTSSSLLKALDIFLMKLQFV